MRRLTIRGRLTLAYAGLFGVSTAVLMGLSYWLLDRNFDRTLSPEAASDALAEVGTQYLIAFAGTLIIAVAAGWVVAGRALAPLGRITRTAREVSGERLGERIDLDGPSDELRELASSFDAMLDRLEASFDGQRRFIANAGHELRSPLSVIRSEAEVALANPEIDPEELRRTAEVVVEATERTERLLDGLLTLARSQRGLVRRDVVDVAGAAEAAVSLLDGEAREAGIVVRLNAEPASAVGDRGLLERLVANLVENAVRHNRRGGHVAVSTSTEGPLAVVAVENTGRRLAPEDIEHLTEPFERLDARRPGAGGRPGAVDRRLGRRGAQRPARARGAAGRRPVRAGVPPGGGQERSRRSAASRSGQSWASNVRASRGSLASRCAAASSRWSTPARPVNPSATIADPLATAATSPVRRNPRSPITFLTVAKCTRPPARLVSAASGRAWRRSRESPMLLHRLIPSPPPATPSRGADSQTI